MVIKDELLGEINEEVRKVFLIDEFDGFKIENNIANFKFPKFECKIINSDVSESIKYMNGWEREGFEFGAYISKEYGKLVPALRVDMSGCETKIKFINGESAVGY